MKPKPQLVVTSAGQPEGGIRADPCPTGGEHERLALGTAPKAAASIRTWIASWNDKPRPFVWHKTADEILDSVAAYCARISDSGH